MSNIFIELANSILNYSCLVISAFGFVGNSIMFILFSKRSLTKLTVSIYFRTMALVNLYINLNLIKIFLFSQYKYALVDQSQLLCKTIAYLTYFTGPLSAWLLVSAGFDRLFAILYPIRFQFFLKPRTSLILTVILVIYNMIFYFHLWFTVTIRPLKTEFNIITNSSEIILMCQKSFGSEFYLTDLVNSAFIPFLFMSCSSMAILKGVLSSRGRIRKFQKESSYNTSRECSMISTRSSGLNRRSVKSRDLKFGITMIILNVFFFITNAPYPIFNFVKDYARIPFSSENYFLSNLTIVFYYFFYSSVFYVQVGSNSLVRREFLKLIM